MTDAQFEKALLSAQPALLSYARKLVRDRDKADDLLQDTNCKLWEKRTYYQDGTYLSWCRVVMRNLLLNQVAVSNRMKYTDGNWASGNRLQAGEDGEGYEDYLHGKYLSVPPNQEDYWLENRIHEAIASLPPHTALLIQLKLQGLGYAQIGQALGIKANNAKQRHFNDIKVLRQLLLRLGLVDELN